MTSWRAALLAVLLLPQLGPTAAGESPLPVVVTSIRPLALIVRAVAGDSLAVRSLPGVDAAPHDFVLRPSGLEAIRSASLFVWMGPALEQPLARVLDRYPAVGSVAVMTALGESASADPHLWLDPRRATDIARSLAAALRERGLLDTASAEAGLQQFELAMAEREAAIAREFNGVETVPFIAMHDGLRAFVTRFGLRQVGAFPAGHDTQPGARSVAALRSAATESRAVCLFREPGDSADLAATIAEGSPMRLVELDTLARGTPDTARGFDDFLQSVAHAMARCLRNAPSHPEESHP